MQPDKWPDWIENSLIAKSADRGKDGKAESLAQHTWLTLSRLGDFIKLRAPLNIQLEEPRLWHVLFWGMFLHDFGKAMPGFQGVLRGDKKLKEEWGGHRHEVFSLAFINWFQEEFTDKELMWLIASIVSHHKDANDIQELYAPPEPGEDDSLLFAQLEKFPLAHAQGLYKWLTECSTNWIQTLGLDMFGVTPVHFSEAPAETFNEKAVLSIRKKLKKYRKFIKKLNRKNTSKDFITLLTLRGMLINSDHSASAHAPSLPSVQLCSEDIVERRGIPRADLYKHQIEAEKSNGSVLLTAPTGSGKTEAALLWASSQTENNYAPPRLFYTLPYQASMNAMLLRLQEIFDSKDKNLVGIQHGRSLLALYRQLMDREYSPEKAHLEAKKLKDLARLNYPPIRVFSPYQMLKAMYRLKGYEAQLSDYHNALFIFDEIHAYETKRLALILKTIEYLRKHYHARFFVMSATFPRLIKNWLNDALGLLDGKEIVASPSLFDKFQRHRLDIIEGEILDSKNLEKIMADARSGQSVLVVCNLVARAQEVYNAMQPLVDDGIRVELLHGRFNSRDRREKELLVQNATGARSEKREPIVLVATQVVEVSLDIDLNTIYTEPAPLEALVQRFGRINRRIKMEDLALVHVFTQPEDGQKIYNEALIEGALKILRRENNKAIDESMVGTWLDEIYQGEIEERWKKEFSETATEFEEAIINTLRPFQSDYALRKEFYKAFDGVDVLPEIYWEEWDALHKKDPLKVKELFVSISYGRLKYLEGKRKAWEEEGGWPIMVSVPYSKELGLDFSDV